MNKFTVSGHDILNEDEVLPVEIRCWICGACALIGEHDYAVNLIELTDWATGHECPRTQSVT